MGDREADLPHEIMERIGFLENCAVALGEDREARRHAHPGTAVSPDHTNLVDARANLVSAIRRALGEPRVSPQQTVTPEEGIRASVVYRTGPLTHGDYTEAIEALIDGRGQLQPDGRNCAVCHDSDHQAWQCRHNPMVLARRYVALMGDFTVYRCFHCGEPFTGEAAREHFGKDEEEVARCLANRAAITQIPQSGRVSPAPPSEEQGERSADDLLEILDNMLEGGAPIDLRHVKEEGLFYVYNRQLGEMAGVFGVFGRASLREAIRDMIDRDVVDEAGEAGFDRGEDPDGCRERMPWVGHTGTLPCGHPLPCPDHDCICSSADTDEQAALRSRPCPVHFGGSSPKEGNHV